MDIDYGALKAPFPDDELEWKPQRIGKKGERVWAQIVPYVQSRAIMERLDSVVGPLGWQTEVVPAEIGGEHGFLCTLSIRGADNGDWVTREDGAPMTDIESFKGGISSALKRVAVQFGIGRYLYSLPMYWAENIQSGRPPANAKNTIKLYSRKENIDGWCYAPKLEDGAIPEVNPEHPPYEKKVDLIAKALALEAKVYTSEQEVSDGRYGVVGNEDPVEKFTVVQLKKYIVNLQGLGSMRKDDEPKESGEPTGEVTADNVVAKIVYWENRRYANYSAKTNAREKWLGQDGLENLPKIMSKAITYILHMKEEKEDAA